MSNCLRIAALIMKVSVEFSRISAKKLRGGFLKSEEEDDYMAEHSLAITVWA